MSLILITDGSADNHTGSGGWACILRSPTALVELIGWAEGTTSNRMEMQAAIEGLKAIPAPSTVTVVADSAYLLNTMKEKWYERWELENERRSSQRPNMDLWKQLAGLASYHTISWVKVKGHSGDYWNERCDRLADMARRGRIQSRNEISGFAEGERCQVMSPSDKQCKLHRGHLGQCLWNGKGSSVDSYGDS